MKDSEDKPSCYTVSELLQLLFESHFQMYRFLPYLEIIFFLFLLTLSFEVIVDSQELTDNVQGGPVYTSHRFLNAHIDSLMY